MAEIPHLETLVKRLQDKPFVLIGVNSDPPKRVPELFRTHGIGWINAIDRSTKGPWATAWNVQAWPTIYVLDHEGIIRHRNVAGPELDRAVDALVRAVPTGVEQPLRTATGRRRL